MSSRPPECVRNCRRTQTRRGRRRPTSEHSLAPQGDRRSAAGCRGRRGIAVQMQRINRQRDRQTALLSRQRRTGEPQRQRGGPHVRRVSSCCCQPSPLSERNILQIMAQIVATAALPTKIGRHAARSASRNDFRDAGDRTMLMYRCCLRCARGSNRGRPVAAVCYAPSTGAVRQSDS